MKLGVIGIIVEKDRQIVGRVQALLSECAHLILGRMGVPDHERGIYVISVIVRGTNEQLSALTGKEISAIARSLAAAQFSVSGLGSFNIAMVTKGGISLDEVSLKTMESKRYPGLYFIGEVLDIDGDTGGYNLQFAYSSANAALDSIFSKY